ncbi:MAG: CHASE domain-containing protein [Caulobacteraceae bacterium]|nr:CHASE domain-containing protein [Caulobacteraceae bacterium]
MRPGAISRLSRRLERQAPVLPVLILAMGLVGAVSGALMLDRLGQVRERQSFEAEVSQATDAIGDRLQTYGAILQAAAGLFAASDTVTPAEFQAFARRVELTQRYPGIQGIGYAQRVAASDVGLFEDQMRQRGLGAFRVRREGGDGGEGFVIIYLEPQDARNAAALGFDMYSNPVRRAAMARARDTGLPAISGKVELVQEIETAKQAGFLIYEPVYRGGEVPAGLEARRAQIQGFVYAPFRAGDLLRAVFGPDEARHYRFAVYAGSADPENLLYASDPDAAAPAERLRAVRQLRVAGGDWTILYWAGPDFPTSSARQVAWLFFLGGLLATALVAAATWRQGQARIAAEREVVARKAIEARQKLLLDELNHRVKNTLATVQSIAAQSLRQGDVASVRQNFEDRLIALSQAHNLLTRDGWRGASLAELADTELRPYARTGAERVRLAGPEVWLAPNTAVAIGMALHELTTNAVKYGALSVDAGRVEVSWSVEGLDAETDRVRILWVEVGGPTVHKPTRRGFGSRLIVGGLAHQLDGEVELEFPADGAVCRIVFDQPRLPSGDILRVGTAA